jgi:hypothetical protein
MRNNTLLYSSKLPAKLHRYNETTRPECTTKYTGLLKQKLEALKHCQNLISKMKKLICKCNHGLPQFELPCTHKRSSYSHRKSNYT